MVLRNFLDEKVFILAVIRRLYMFSIKKKSQNKLDLMQSCLLKRFTKLDKLNFRGSNAKNSHLSNFPFSFRLHLYQCTIWHLVKTFRIKTIKNSIKICHKSMQSWTNYKLRFKTGCWCIAEYYLPKSNGYILHNKIVPMYNFWLISSKITRHWNRTFKLCYIHAVRNFDYICLDISLASTQDIL